MGQNTEIIFKSSRYRPMRFNMWLAILAVGVVFASRFLHNWTLFIAGWGLLIVALLVGKHLARVAIRHDEEHGLRCEKCGQPIDVGLAMKGEIPEDHFARCRSCGEPFGTIKRTE